MTPSDILQFWFKECTPKQWFSKDENFDAKLRERFLDVHGKIVRSETKDWRVTPQGRLAEIIVLDQFSRNMFRNFPEAFAGDSLALSLAREAVKAGDDKKLTPNERQFLYMPYMHSESKEAHEEALGLFESLGGEEALKYERDHKEIIDRFGRYPHRNAILGRVSTPEEIEFMKTHTGF